MPSPTLNTIETRIRRLQRRLASVGNMRPGTLGVQYRHPAEKKGAFYQISYTRKGRSRSEYVRPENLPAVRREIAAYHRFNSLVDRLLDLSIQASRIRYGARGAHLVTHPART